MATPLVTPEMGLTEPAVGNTLSPSWALILNNNFSILDGHNHTPGSGAPIVASSLDINTDLSFNGNNLLGLNSLVFNGAVGGTPATLSVYSNGTDLFYKDINGNPIQLTANGSPNAGTGNITGLPSTPTGGAGVSWGNAQGTFSFAEDSGATGANLDAGSIIMRYPGSYPTPSGHGIILEVPSTINSLYALTLPALPGALSLMQIDTDGTLSPGPTSTNPNFPGKALQEGGANVVVSNANATNSLAVIRGSVSSTGTVSGGEGFSSSGSGGDYVVTFDTALADHAAIAITPTTSNLTFAVTSITNSTFEVQFRNNGGVSTASGFLFIAMGQRA